jgi:hypothetical protein
MKHPWDWYAQRLVAIAIFVGVLGFMGYQLYDAVTAGVIVRPSKINPGTASYRDDPFLLV